MRSKLKPKSAISFALALLSMGATSLDAAEPVVNYVIHISMDGLRPDAVTTLGASELPNFYRLRTRGAFTDNARTDFDYTITMANHTCQLTGYAVTGAAGHNWTYNSDPAPGQTLASNKGSYIPSVFDQTHDRGLRTGFFASKSKFALYPQSWDEVNGAPDLIAPDHGRNKMDVSKLIFSTAELVDCLASNMLAQPFNYVFVHFADPDLNGHGAGWDFTPGTPYHGAIKLMDEHLGKLFGMIDGYAQLSNHTAVILTTDHGGSGFSHSDPLLSDDYTIPLYVWGPTVTPGAELYAINQGSRKNPGSARPDYAESKQPIRDGDVANLILMLLGLPSVPGSTINADQSLAVTAPFAEDFRLMLAGSKAVFTFNTRSNSSYDIESTINLTSGSWSIVACNIPGTGGRVTNSMMRPPGRLREFFRLQPHP